MDVIEKLIKDFESLIDQNQQQVIDFIEFLNQKQEKELNNAIDEVINDNAVVFKKLIKASESSTEFLHNDKDYDWDDL